MPLHVPGLPLPATVGTTGDVLAITSPSPLTTEWVDTTSSVLAGMNGQPWAPSLPVGPELWATANMQAGAGYNSTLTIPTLTADGSAKNMRTRINLGNLANQDDAYRLSFNVSSMVGDGWAGVSALMTDSGGTLLANSDDQFFVTASSPSPTGKYYIEFKAGVWAVGGTYFELRLDTFNNATTGALTVSDVSLRKIAHVTRPLYFGESWTGTPGYPEIYTQTFDPVRNEHRLFATGLGDDGDLAVSLKDVTAYSSPLIWQRPPADALFVATSVSAADAVAGTVVSLPTGVISRIMRANNNDQIFQVRKADLTFELRGNTHGGETINGSVLYEWADVDGTWTSWDGLGKRLHTATRFRLTLPTKITRSAPDSDNVATVEHTAVWFPDGMMRMDRTTTFVQATTLQEHFEWMSSHETAVPKIGRIGRGLIVIDEVDIFPKVAAPATPTAGTSGSGGTLPAATYTYAVTSLTEGGESLPTATVAQVTTGATSTVTVTWVAVSGATGYRIYGRTAGRLALLATAGPGATSWIDDYSAAATAPLPPIVSTARQLGATTTALDSAISNDAYWTVWFDPVIGMAIANIYDRDACLERDGVATVKTRLECGSGLVKSYANLYWDDGATTYEVANGTVWTATHWAYTYCPQDPDNYHLEAAMKASELAALRAAYPAS